MENTTKIGRSGEEECSLFLKKKGYRILHENYRTVFGEIDIIAEKSGGLVFIEVKKRNSLSYGHPENAVDDRKKKRIIRSAVTYLKSCVRARKYGSYRFDVMCLGPHEELVHIKNAFLSDDLYII